MWPRFNRNDLGIVAHSLGILMIFFGAIMVAPLAVSILHGEWAISCHYIFGMGLALTLGALLRLAKIEPQRMGRKHAIAITGLVWIFGAVVAAVPLYLSGHYVNFLDAVFEGVSGLTATGLSLVQDIDHMSMADNMWRFVMQFVGGQGVVVVALSLGIFTRTGNALYTSEAREESVVPNVKNTARFILRFATAAVLIGTVVSTIVLIFIGMEPLRGFFHGLWITIGAYDTGGFAPGSLSLIPYHSWPLEIIAMLLMMFGALSFALVAQVSRGNWREFVRDIEVRTLALYTTGMVVVFVAALAAGDFLTDYSGLMRRGIFTIVSATTNTGFQVLSTAQITTLLSSGAFMLVAIAMAVGGSSASTAGGIKALRVGLIFKGIALYIRRILQPQSAHITSSYNHIGKHQLAPEMLSSALIIASLYVISYVVGALIGIAHGYEALESTFESISAASNAGLSSGIVQPGMPVGLEVVYIIQMWLGRLEFITLLALFTSLIVSIIPRRKPKPEGPQRQRDITRDGFVKTLVVVVLAVVLAAALVFAPLGSAIAGPVQRGDTSDLTQAAEQESGSIATAQPGRIQVEATAQNEEISVAPTAVTIGELAEVPEHLDNAVVSFEGEVVGDSITSNAGENHVWVTLNQGQDSITVLLPRMYLEQIEYFGSYAARGTVLEIVGIFHLACDQHDGSSDVHATSVLNVVDPGGVQEHTATPFFLLAGLALIVVAGALMVLYNVLLVKRR